MKSKSNEFEYLMSLINKRDFDEIKFLIGNFEQGRIITGFSSQKDKADMSLLFKISTWIKNANLIKFGIEISLKESINLTYKTDALSGFNLLEVSTKYEEKLVYYYIENCVFRLTSLWDTLFQLINVLENIDLPSNEVSFWGIRDKLKEISDYRGLLDYKKEDDDTDVGDPWKGNNKYLYDLRNAMSHRFALTNSVFSEQAITIREHPSFILKRLCEDYNYLIRFFDSVLFSRIKNKLKEASVYE